MTGDSHLPSAPPRHRLLGLPVDQVSLNEAEERAAAAVTRGIPLRIAITNHNKCFLAVRDPTLRGFLEAADLVLAESSVSWGARVLGRRGVGPGWGSVLMERLLERADREGWSVFLLGARPEVLSRLVERLERELPGVRVVGTRDGYFGAPEEAEVRDRIREARPDLLFVGMGSPRQERFIHELGRDSAVRVALGVGGSFDVHSETIPDAPSWVRGSGFEWLWRSIWSPRLLRRYLVVIPWFVGWVLLERLLGRTPRLRGAAGPDPG